jgi:hypothetical protein
MNTLYSSNAFLEATAFQLRSHIRGRTRSLFTKADTEDAERRLLDTLDSLPLGSLLLIDFSGLRISSEAARQLLRRALLRITTGELGDRFLVLGDLGDSLYNVDVMLIGESLTAIERSEDEGPQLRGVVDPAIRDTYAYLTHKPVATASMVLNDLGLSTISAATNRLTTLTKLGLARRVAQRPVSGGGREYIYAAVQ